MFGGEIPTFQILDEEKLFDFQTEGRKYDKTLDLKFFLLNNKFILNFN